MEKFEVEFFKGNIKTSQVLASEAGESAAKFSAIFEAHAIDQVPTIYPSRADEKIENEHEFYAEDEAFKVLRAITDEALFQQQIKALEQAALTGSMPEKAQSFYTQGHLFLAAHHYEESMHCFRQAVKNEPLNSVYNGICGQVLARLNASPFEALAYLENAVDLDRKNARHNWNRALILLRLFKDLHDERFLNSAIFELAEASLNVLQHQKSLQQAILQTEKELGEIVAFR